MSMPDRVDPMRFISWNADNNRRNMQVLKEFREANQVWHPDVWLTQEFSEYVETFREHVNDWYIRTGPDDDKWGRDAAFILPKGWPFGRSITAHELEQGWERAPQNRHRGLHPSRTFNVMVDLGWYDRVGDVHFPPSWTKWNDSLRQKAGHEYLEKADWLCENWNEKGFRWMLGGDWNAHWFDREMRNFVKKHAGHRRLRGIDGFIFSPGITSHHYQRVKHGRSNHKLAIVDTHPAPL